MASLSRCPKHFSPDLNPGKEKEITTRLFVSKQISLNGNRTKARVVRNLLQTVIDNRRQQWFKIVNWKKRVNENKTVQSNFAIINRSKLYFIISALSYLFFQRHFALVHYSSSESSPLKFELWRIEIFLVIFVCTVMRL